MHNYRREWLQFGTSIFTKMTMEAVKYEALNLAQGFPDFDGPDVIKRAAIKAIEGGLNQYAPSSGLLQLRKLIAERYQAKYDMSWSAEDEVTVYSGATEALYVAISSLLQPGDEIIVMAPCYDSYVPAAHGAGAMVKVVALQEPDWKLSFEALHNAISEKTKLLVLNTPHNPTGKVFSNDELTMIAQLSQKHDFLVLTDEVYEELVFDDSKHLCLASYPGMRDRTITVSSTSKTFSFTGWKIGYAVASERLSAIMRALHQFTVFCSATPLQHAMLPAFELSTSYYDDLRVQYAMRRDVLVAELRRAGFNCNAPDGSYFVAADYRSHDKRFSGFEDLQVALELTRKAGVACVPFAAFYPGATQEEQNRTGYLRFAFCKDVAILKAAGEKLQSYFAV